MARSKVFKVSIHISIDKHNIWIYPNTIFILPDVLMHSTCKKHYHWKNQKTNHGHSAYEISNSSLDQRDSDSMERIFLYF